VGSFIVVLVAISGQCVDEFASFQCGQGFDGFAGLFLGEAQVIDVLEIEPKLGTGAEEVSESKSDAVRSLAGKQEGLGVGAATADFE
jgi:hypothetical protein